MPATVAAPEYRTFDSLKSADSLVAVYATFVVCSAPVYTAELAVPATVIVISAFVIAKDASVTLNVASTFPSS